MIARLSLATGLVMAVFVVLHLINHALGLVSVDAMEAMRRPMSAAWGSLPGGILLYGAVFCHMIVALIRLYNLNHFRLGLWQWVQLASGLAIPLMLISHALPLRLIDELTNINPTYPAVLASMNQIGFESTLNQTLLLILTSLHVITGLHFWLRLKPGYERFLPILYPVGILIPVFSLIGYLRGLADMATVQTATSAPLSLMDQASLLPVDNTDFIIMTTERAENGFFAAILVTLVARFIRKSYRARTGKFTLTLPSGKQVQGIAGQSVLECLNIAGIPHASVCGGKARCTTCRIRVQDIAENLPPLTAAEEQALNRINAAPNIRLACQLTPKDDLGIAPLLPADINAISDRRRGGVAGHEQHVTAMFVDLRGSTGLCEQKLPYDVVFILNLFFAEMAEALQNTGGHYAQFAGDGLLALYGIEGDPADGCRAALRGAAEMQRRVQQLSNLLKDELATPLRIGIGVHTGQAIVGSMGPPTTPLLSAVGDNINIAARIESQCKTWKVPMIISVDVADLAGLDSSALPKEELAVRGRDGAPLPVFLVNNPASMDRLLAQKDD